MNNLQFIRGQGGVPKSLPGEDHISGFAMFIPEAESLPTPESGIDGFDTDDRIKPISTIETAESYGIKADATSWYTKVLHYHLSEAFRINPGISLYVGIFNIPASGFDFSEIKEIQNYAQGRIRQMAVWAPNDLASTDITSLQGHADTLRDQAKPVQILYGCTVSDISDLDDMRSAGTSRVSPVISQDGEGRGAELYEDAENTSTNSITHIGMFIGFLSLAKVHESIGWVQKFNSGVSLPAFADGTLLRDLDPAAIETLDANGYLFLVTYPGIGGSYPNDSHTLDEITSDYAFIEANRTMDKAERGIRTYLTPYLGAPLYVNPETGNLRIDTVKFLETLAGKQLEDMEAAGELSGYTVEVDPEQNVLSTSTVEFVIKPVQVGVMRKMKIKIGYTTKTA
jgi:hypothetical protein